MAKIFELKDELNQINEFVKKNADEGKITDEVLLSLIQRQNALLGKLINSLEELGTREDLESEEDQ